MIVVALHMPVFELSVKTGRTILPFIPFMLPTYSGMATGWLKETKDPTRVQLGPTYQILRNEIKCNLTQDESEGMLGSLGIPLPSP